MIFPCEAAGVDGHRYGTRLHALEQAILALGGGEFPTLRKVALARVEDALGQRALLASVGLAAAGGTARSPTGFGSAGW